MAEKAAHFSFSSQIKPSIFEIVAQDTLNSTLQPAFQKIAEFLSECNPNYLNWLCKYQDETFLLFNGLLQSYYLRNYDASFSEYFYGLQRVTVKNTRLSLKGKCISLVFLIVLPYIQKKFNKRLNAYKLEKLEGLLGNDRKSRSKKVLLHLHSYFTVTWTCWLMLNYLRYMSNEIESQNPILYLLNIKLKYIEESEDVISFWMDLVKGKLSLKQFGVGIIPSILRSSFEVGAFSVQFLQAWYKEKSNYSITALPVVPPPMPDPNADSYRGKCPICLLPWKIATILPVSGYVYCFSCIVKHLREVPQCPVTKYPAKVSSLVRLYD